MVNKGPNTNGSQFYVTLRGDLDFLDGKYTIFGEIAEGEDVLERINAAYCDKHHRPYRNIRIKHTIILDNPFDDDADTEAVDEPASPAPQRDDRPEADDEIVEEDEMTQAEAERATHAAEAKSRAVVLEMVGDIPDADMKPPENVLFVAKLNPLTQDADLDIIFGRFGPCTVCTLPHIITSDIIRDCTCRNSYRVLDTYVHACMCVCVCKYMNVFIYIHKNTYAVQHHPGPKDGRLSQLCLHRVRNAGGGRGGI